MACQNPALNQRQAFPFTAGGEAPRARLTRGLSLALPIALSQSLCFSPSTPTRPVILEFQLTRTTNQTAWTRKWQEKATRPAAVQKLCSDNIAARRNIKPDKENALIFPKSFCAMNKTPPLINKHADIIVYSRVFRTSESKKSPPFVSFTLTTLSLSLSLSLYFFRSVRRWLPLVLQRQLIHAAI